MKNKTLVILAAGMGSRFGGPKQLYPVGPNGEFIMDYSIYSAIKYGFNKVVFVTREELLDSFKETIEKRINDKIKIEYALQKLDYIPEGFTVPIGREKPWGTAHAIYCAKEFINEDFAVITSDDFYGDEGIKDLSNALDREDYSIIGYQISETLSENGSVKRGVIFTKDGYVTDVIESVCTLQNDGVLIEPLNKNIETKLVPLDNPVSMLMYGLKPDIFSVIENKMITVFKTNKDSLDTFEFYLPDILDEEIKSGRKILDVPTKSKWLGLTYKEDIDILCSHIKEEIEKGIYQKNLWK